MSQSELCNLREWNLNVGLGSVIWKLHKFENWGTAIIVWVEVAEIVDLQRQTKKKEKEKNLEKEMKAKYR